MKLKVLILLAAMLLPFSESRAVENTMEVGYSTFAVVGVRCSTGTAIQINATRPAGLTGNIAGYRIRDQHASASVWLGGVNVSTDTALVTAAVLANLGEELKAGEAAPWAFGKNYLASGVPLTPIYCKAADAAGTAGAILSVVWFGY